MAYVTGTANSLADLLTAIQSACTANGWTLSGNVLHKGTCYAQVMQAASSLQILGGDGIDGSNALTGAATAAGFLIQPMTGTTFAWPITYEVHVHTAPDEVYVVINYASGVFECAAFGQSAMPGLVGSGNWYCGPRLPAGGALFVISVGEQGSSHEGAGYSLFCRNSVASGGVHHSLDGDSWSVSSSGYDWASVIAREPNQWNQESILIPIRVYATRPSGFISPVLECAHARFVNIANLADQQIVTIGSTKWKVYPWYQRGSSFTFGAAARGDSGLYGHAIEYDGP